MTSALRTCVSPEGKFVCGIHRPAYRVRNLRQNDFITTLGQRLDHDICDNRANFPQGDVAAEAAGIVYEIPNAFGFRGATYIKKAWADQNAADTGGFRLPEPAGASLDNLLSHLSGGRPLSAADKLRILQALPEPLQIALAETGKDPEELALLARISCDFVENPETGRPEGLVYKPAAPGVCRAKIHSKALFEALANNSCLPDDYKDAMVLRPGVQGGSEIVGEFTEPGGDAHVFEYLRSNSYIPWGHYAANTAHDRVLYRLADLTASDIRGMRHLYYQRTYVRLAEEMGLKIDASRRQLSGNELESLRGRIVERLNKSYTVNSLAFNRTLWGWNFGFDLAPSGYRLHASHQQAHQQYAMIPGAVSGDDGSFLPAYALGDQVEVFTAAYRRQTGVGFFDAYIRAIENNHRMLDAPDGPRSLLVYADDRVLLFVPKAQMSQWELQLISRQPVSHILDADPQTRESMDRAIFLAVKALDALGARLITAYECAGRFDAPDSDQRLMYTFFPRLPASPPTFSEMQLRWIIGHYPEDFAAACRGALEGMAPGAGRA